MPQKLKNWFSQILNLSGRKDQGNGILSGVDLGEALRLLHHSGYPDPRKNVSNQKELLQHVLHALCDLSLHDGLTGLVNPRHFRGALDREAERATRTGQPLSLLLLDLDHFKKINDTYGHVSGDTVLRAVAGIIRCSTRNMDTGARYGGEEFAVILPNTPSNWAIKIADRLRARVQNEKITLEVEKVVRVTISIGVAYSLPEMQLYGGDLLKRADSQLYRAKSQGRNRVCCEIPQSVSVSKEEKVALFGDQNPAKETP